MPNYDNLFTGQPIQQEEQPFDKTGFGRRENRRSVRASTP